MSERQYLRQCKLIVADKSGKGLDLSPMRIVFQVRKTDAQTPNTANIKIYNLATDTARQIREEFKSIILHAGYPSNFGVIFSGNIKQVRFGREQGTDTYVNITAGDGDYAYNYSVVNTTLAAGAKQSDQMAAAGGAMVKNGVQQGFMAETGDAALPRGKVMYGMARDYLRQSAQSTDTSWSVQDGKLQVVSLTDTLPNQAVVLNSKSGLVGFPEQTNEGVSARCLLNPLLRIGGKVVINERDVMEAILPDTVKKDQPNKPASIAKDGVYKIISVDYQGDTRGSEWYTNLTCLAVDDSAPKGEKVKKAWKKVKK